jgi:hypothetical protein
MKVFISSLILGYEDMRAAAVAAVRSLGHEPITAEALDPGVTSPRVACLQGVRDAELVVILLGASYGTIQPVSGLSATHEEWREAKDRRRVVAFVQEGVEREPRQGEFVQEVQDWADGLFRGSFRSAEDLREGLTRTLHRLELASASTSADPAEMLSRAIALLPREERGFVRMTGPLLHVAVVGGPAQTILRPVEIERPELARDLLREATYGKNSVFDPAHGSKQSLAEGMLHLSQPSGAEILLDERGSVRLSVPVARGTGMVGALIEENVAEAMDRALAQAAEVLTRVDDVQRLSRVVIVARLGEAGAMGWRTRLEDQASPNSMTIAHAFDQNQRTPVHFQPPDRPRAALAFDRARMVEDLVTLLRRQWR